MTRNGRTEEHPNLIKSREIPILRRGQKAFRIGSKLTCEEEDREDWSGQCG